MDHTTDGFEGVFAYIDDSHVSSPDRQTYRHCNLEAFFTAVAINGLAINLEKCVFATPSREILGHMISVTGAVPKAGHAAEVESCPASGYHATATAKRPCEKRQSDAHKESLYSFLWKVEEWRC
jgi:hypothetical protein